MILVNVNAICIRLIGLVIIIIIQGRLELKTLLLRHSPQKWWVTRDYLVSYAAATSPCGLHFSSRLQVLKPNNTYNNSSSRRPLILVIVIQLSSVKRDIVEEGIRAFCTMPDEEKVVRILTALLSISIC
jgi:hypothetical protein